MSTFVLIHGGMHGAWCWYKVVSLLQEMGHKVIAPDLPGHGIDKTPIASVTFSSYVNRVCSILDEQPEPVVLVGHSMGGLTITAVAEARPGKIKTLVYLSALLPANGEQGLQVMESDPDATLSSKTVLTADQKGIIVPGDFLQDAFYGDCDNRDIALARLLLVPEPVEPGTTPIYTTEENFGRVHRVYICCLKDQAIPLEAQQRLLKKGPCQQVITMDTSHSPFFSAPEELSRHLVDIGLS